MDIITDKSFKYNLEKLDSTSDEFIFVKNFYDVTEDSMNAMKNTRKSSGYIPKINDFQIYEVVKNNQVKVDEKQNNLMLFHGTTQEGAAKILKEGFKNSERGWFGKGVYMTDCSDTAFDYSCLRNSLNRKRNNSNNNKKKSKSNTTWINIFVNEVVASENLQTFEFDTSKLRKDVDTPLKYPFNKHIHKFSPQATEENYRKDQKGRKYRNIGHDDSSALDEFVAEANVTIPRYLIQFEYELRR